MERNLIGEVISIGDEIICGKLLDTNSQWFSQKLGELGVDVRFHTSLGDRLEDYRVAFQNARQRADVIVCSGGLGPTEDDLTSEALAALAGVELEFDDKSWAHIETIFARRNRPIAPKNRKQALLPKGSRAIFNPNGTAPGIDLSLNNPEGRPVRIFAFPGVPAELREMWPSVASEIQKLAGQRIFYHHTLNCFGAGESDIEAMIPPEIMRRDRDPLVGITASQATISLRASTIGKSIEECRQFVQPTLNQLRAVLGDLVYGEQDVPLESIVCGMLQKARHSLSIADLGLEGRLYQALGAFDPAGDTIQGGMQLSLKSAQAAFPSAFSENVNMGQTLAKIADQIRERFGSELGLAIGPLPPPSAERQVFLVAITDGVKQWIPELPCAGHPAIRLIRATKQILNFVRLQVLR